MRVDGEQVGKLGRTGSGRDHRTVERSLDSHWVHQTERPYEAWAWDELSWQREEVRQTWRVWGRWRMGDQLREELEELEVKLNRGRRDGHGQALTFTPHHKAVISAQIGSRKASEANIIGRIESRRPCDRVCPCPVVSHPTSTSSFPPSSGSSRRSYRDHQQKQEG